jgi:hypothetical protein
VAAILGFLSSVKEEILVRNAFFAIKMWSCKVPRDFVVMKIVRGLPGVQKSWRDDTSWKN